MKIIDPTRKSTKARPVIIQVFRLALFLSILLTIRYQHQKISRKSDDANESLAINLEKIKGLFSGPVKVAKWESNGTANVLDAEGKPTGSVLNTVEQSENIVGYSGPTTLLIVINDKGQLMDVVIHSSDDTPEHVQAVLDDSSFLKQWNGMSWQEAAGAEVSTVSGATLTSLAIVRTLRTRLGNPQPSLNFPQEVTLEELKSVWPEVDTFRPVPGITSWFVAIDAGSNTIGYFLRSSPIADSIHGYQGPTDFLAFFDAEGRFKRIQIRSSYDNQKPEPFVDYVKDDQYFLVEFFSGLSLGALAEFDENQVEGVSGATRTSTGVFLALQHVAKQIVRDQSSQQAKSNFSFPISWNDLGTMIILVGALVMAFTRLKRSKAIRRIYLWILVIYLGLINGDMLSQTLMVGWSQHGVPWTSAVSLVLLSLVAITIPVFARKNIYCQQVCPFGAAQQLAGKIVKKKPKLPKRLIRVAVYIPAALVLFVSWAAVRNWGFNLASLEPFDAFHFRLAGYATLTLAIGSLGLSFWIPMAYCRFGCPTGAVLTYLKRGRRSDRLAGADLFALAILGICLAHILFM